MRDAMGKMTTCRMQRCVCVGGWVGGWVCGVCVCVGVCTCVHYITYFLILLNRTFFTWKKRLLDIQNLRHLMEIKDRKILSCSYEKWKKDMLHHISSNKAEKHHQQVTTAWCFRAWQSKFLHANKIIYVHMYIHTGMCTYPRETLFLL